jgi:hypothetical protein
MGRIQLYCPSTKKTVDGFVIGAFQNLEQVLQGVRLALDIKYAALYTVEAKPINEPSTLEDDERVLVATSAKETMLPDAPPEWVLYDGEEGDNVNPDTDSYGQEWDVSIRQRSLRNYGHLRNLGSLRPREMSTYHESQRAEAHYPEQASHYPPLQCGGSGHFHTRL